MLLKILFAHMLGDYFFQTEYIARNKGSDNYILLVHSVLYTFAVYIIFGNHISYLFYILMILSHFIIDYIKARDITPKLIGDKRALILDQLLHYLIILVGVI
jgi:hypothetical protein